MNNLVIHQGGRMATLEEIAEVHTPSPEGRWFPVAHKVVVDRFTTEIEQTGLTIVNRQFGLANDDARLFGIMELRNGSNREDFALVVGIRNSHDKSFPVGLAVGSKVFVCDNLAFSSEVVIRRKHTVNVMRDLPGLIHRAVGQLSALKQHQNLRIDHYQNMVIDDKTAHDVIVRALYSRVVGSQKVIDVVNEWREPRHDEFKSRTVWSLFNAFTEVMKSYQAADLAWRTRGLHGICDAACGVPAFNLAKTIEGDAVDVEVEVMN